MPHPGNVQEMPTSRVCGGRAGATLSRQSLGIPGCDSISKDSGRSNKDSRFFRPHSPLSG